MPKNREPIALIQAKGKKHLTKAEIERRQREEVKVDLLDTSAPSWLPGGLIEQFDLISKKLIHIGIFTELDTDALAMYLISLEHYKAAVAEMSREEKSGDVDSRSKAQTRLSRTISDCSKLASSLGLNISGRCKLVIPAVEDDTPDL